LRKNKTPSRREQLLARGSALADRLAQHRALLDAVDLGDAVAQVRSPGAEASDDEYEALLDTVEQLVDTLQPRTMRRRRDSTDTEDRGDATLQRMYELWCAGATKSDLERRFLNKPESHGKLFSSLVREHLGIETEKRSALTTERDELRREVTRLSALLRDHGIDPTTGRITR